MQAAVKVNDQEHQLSEGRAAENDGQALDGPMEEMNFIVLSNDQIAELQQMQSQAIQKHIIIDQIQSIEKGHPSKRAVTRETKKRQRLDAATTQERKSSLLLNTHTGAEEPVALSTGFMSTKGPLNGDYTGTPSIEHANAANKISISAKNADYEEVDQQQDQRSAGHQSQSKTRARAGSSEGKGSPTQRQTMLILDKDALDPPNEEMAEPEPHAAAVEGLSWPAARTPYSHPSGSIMDGFLNPIGLRKSSAGNSGAQNSTSQMTSGVLSQSQAGTVFRNKFGAMEGLQKIQLRVQVEGEITSIKDKMAHFFYATSKQAQERQAQYHRRRSQKASPILQKLYGTFNQQKRQPLNQNNVEKGLITYQIKPQDRKYGSTSLDRKANNRDINLQYHDQGDGRDGNKKSLLMRKECNSSLSKLQLLSPIISTRRKTKRMDQFKLMQQETLSSQRVRRGTALEEREPDTGVTRGSLEPMLQGVQLRLQPKEKEESISKIIMVECCQQLKDSRHQTRRDGTRRSKSSSRSPTRRQVFATSVIQKNNQRKRERLVVPLVQIEENPDLFVEGKRVKSPHKAQINEDIDDVAALTAIKERQHQNQLSKDGCDAPNRRIVQADAEYANHVKDFQRESQEFDQKIAEAQSRDSHGKPLAAIGSGTFAIRGNQAPPAEAPLSTGAYFVSKIRSKRKSQDVRVNAMVPKSQISINLSPQKIPKNQPDPICVKSLKLLNNIDTQGRNLVDYVCMNPSSEEKIPSMELAESSYTKRFGDASLINKQHLTSHGVRSIQSPGTKSQEMTPSHSPFWSLKLNRTAEGDFNEQTNQQLITSQKLSDQVSKGGQILMINRRFNVGNPFLQSGRDSEAAENAQVHDKKSYNQATFLNDMKLKDNQPEHASIVPPESGPLQQHEVSGRAQRYSAAYHNVKKPVNKSEPKISQKTRTTAGNLIESSLAGVQNPEHYEQYEPYHFQRMQTANDDGEFVMSEATNSPPTKSDGDRALASLGVGGTMPGASQRTTQKGFSTQGERTPEKQPKMFDSDSPTVERLGEQQINETTHPPESIQSSGLENSQFFQDVEESQLRNQVHQTKLREQRYLNQIRKQNYKNQTRAIQRYYHRSQVQSFLNLNKEEINAFRSYTDSTQQITGDRAAVVSQLTNSQVDPKDSVKLDAAHQRNNSYDQQLVVYGSVNFSRTSKNKLNGIKIYSRSSKHRKSIEQKDKGVEIMRGEGPGQDGSWSNDNFKIDGNHTFGRMSDLQNQKQNTDTTSQLLFKNLNLPIKPNFDIKSKVRQNLNQSGQDVQDSILSHSRPLTQQNIEKRKRKGGGGPLDKVESHRREKLALQSNHLLHTQVQFHRRGQAMALESQLQDQKTHGDTDTTSKQPHSFQKVSSNNCMSVYKEDQAPLLHESLFSQPLGYQFFHKRQRSQQRCRIISNPSHTRGKWSKDFRELPQPVRFKKSHGTNSILDRQVQVDIMGGRNIIDRERLFGRLKYLHRQKIKESQTCPKSPKFGDDKLLQEQPQLHSNQSLESLPQRSQELETQELERQIEQIFNSEKQLNDAISKTDDKPASRSKSQSRRNIAESNTEHKMQRNKKKLSPLSRKKPKQIDVDQGHVANQVTLMRPSQQQSPLDLKNYHRNDTKNSTERANGNDVTLPFCVSHILQNRTMHIKSQDDAGRSNDDALVCTDESLKVNPNGTDAVKTSSVTEGVRASTVTDGAGGPVLKEKEESSVFERTQRQDKQQEGTWRGVGEQTPVSQSFNILTKDLQLARKAERSPPTESPSPRLKQQKSIGKIVIEKTRSRPGGQLINMQQTTNTDHRDSDAPELTVQQIVPNAMYSHRGASVPVVHESPKIPTHSGGSESFLPLPISTTKQSQQKSQKQIETPSMDEERERLQELIDYLNMNMSQEAALQFRRVNHQIVKANHSKIMQQNQHRKYEQIEGMSGAYRRDVGDYLPRQPDEAIRKGHGVIEKLFANKAVKEKQRRAMDKKQLKKFLMMASDSRKQRMDKLKKYIDEIEGNQQQTVNPIDQYYDVSMESSQPNIILLKYARRRSSESGLGYDISDDQLTETRLQEMNIEMNKVELTKSREKLRRKVARSKLIKSVDEFKLVYAEEGDARAWRSRRNSVRMLQGDARVNQKVDGQLKLSQILHQGLEHMQMEQMQGCQL